MDSVGVRELRQNLSVYLRRVKAGESLEVTERGNKVAELVPAVRRESKMEQWRREGKVKPARGHLRDLPPPRKPRPGEKSIGEILREVKEDKI